MPSSSCSKASQSRPTALLPGRPHIKRRQRVVTRTIAALSLSTIPNAFRCAPTESFLCLCPCPVSPRDLPVMPLPYVVSCDILGAASLVLWRAVFAHAVPAGACHKRPAMCWAVQGSVGSGGIGGTHDVCVCVGGGGGGRSVLGRGRGCACVAGVRGRRVLGVTSSRAWEKDGTGGRAGADSRDGGDGASKEGAGWAPLSACVSVCVCVCEQQSERRCVWGAGGLCGGLR